MVPCKRPRSSHRCNRWKFLPVPVSIAAFSPGFRSWNVQRMHFNYEPIPAMIHARGVSIGIDPRHGYVNTLYLTTLALGIYFRHFLVNLSRPIPSRVLTSGHRPRRHFCRIAGDSIKPVESDGFITDEIELSGQMGSSARLLLNYHGKRV